ncbi:hypothetical protein SLA2020_063890 [Shorea laevis]
MPASSNDNELNILPSTSVVTQQSESQPYGPWIVVEKRKKKPVFKGKNSQNITSTQFGGKQKDLPSTMPQTMKGKMVGNTIPTSGPNRRTRIKGNDEPLSDQPPTSNGQQSFALNASNSRFTRPTANATGSKFQTKLGFANSAGANPKPSSKGQFNKSYPVPNPVAPSGSSAQVEPVSSKPKNAPTKSQMAQKQGSQPPLDLNPSQTFSIPHVHSNPILPPHPDITIVSCSLCNDGLPNNPLSPNEQESRSLSGERGPGTSSRECPTATNPNPIPPTTVLDHGSHFLNLAFTTSGTEGDQPTEISTSLSTSGIRSQGKDRSSLSSGSKLQLRRRQHRQITHPYLPVESLLSVQQTSLECLGGNRGDEADGSIHPEPLQPNVTPRDGLRASGDSISFSVCTDGDEQAVEPDTSPVLDGST